MKSSFDLGSEAWCSYDYHASVPLGANFFVMAPWEPSGGVNDSGYIWTNEAGWSADTPERPISVLPLLIYRHWVGLGPVDLREARVSVYLRGDGLELGGARCYFWVVGRGGEKGSGGRWHYASNPLHISDGRWADEPNVFTLHNDESLWHRSWSADPANPPSLDDLLGNCRSYGFSFVDFGQLPRGRFAMDEIEIELAQP